MWNWIAKFLATERIANYLIVRAMLTPYLHISSQDGKDIYMYRYWLFNPYDGKTNKPKYWWCPWSIRIHHIVREDHDRDLHDHPWNARTFILRGRYQEIRLVDGANAYYARQPGDTAKLDFGEYHRIISVSQGGCTTLFISGPYQGVWGFLVNGVKVPWKEYLGIK